MGLLDKATAMAKIKREVVSVQVKLPPELYHYVNSALKLRNVTWQRILLDAVELVRDEAQKQKKT